MWPQRWALSSACLLIIASQASAAKVHGKPAEKSTRAETTSITSPSAIGPSSPEEAEFLWSEGKADFSASRYAEAARKLQRFVDRYPSAKGAPEAELLLGRSYLRSGEGAKAIPPLREYIQSHSALPAGQEARIDLGQAYLSTRKFNEAFLVSSEMIESKAVTPRFEQAGLLLRADALLGLGREERAAQVLDSARRLTSKETSSELEELQIRMQLRVCSKLPTALRMEEAQALAQYGRRGDCLLLTAPMLRRAYSGSRPLEQDGPVLQRIRAELLAGLNAFQEACLKPPSPSAKRSGQQLKQYQAELSDRLLKIFADRKARLADILRQATDEKPSAEREEQLQALLRAIEQVN